MNFMKAMRDEMIKKCEMLGLYAVTSRTNYGEVIHLINAENESEVKDIAKDNDEIWEGYEIELINTVKRGIVFVGGGESG